VEAVRRYERLPCGGGARPSPPSPPRRPSSRARQGPLLRDVAMRIGAGLAAIAARRRGAAGARRGRCSSAARPSPGRSRPPWRRCRWADATPPAAGTRGRCAGPGRRGSGTAPRGPGARISRRPRAGRSRPARSGCRRRSSATPARPSRRRRTASPAPLARLGRGGARDGRARHRGCSAGAGGMATPSSARWIATSPRRRGCWPRRWRGGRRWESAMAGIGGRMRSLLAGLEAIPRPRNGSPPGGAERRAALRPARREGPRAGRDHARTAGVRPPDGELRRGPVGGAGGHARGRHHHRRIGRRGHRPRRSRT
jgi:hypothetical protein